MLTTTQLSNTLPHKSTIQEMITSMKSSLHEWHKLLQITGGDLSLDKCKIILLKWKQVGERGNMNFVRKISEEDTIKITSVHNGENEQHLERLDPDKAERILGIRLPLTGSMEIECAYRKKNLLDFCKKLYKAPLSNYDTHIAYQSRYKAIAWYPFPVTLFSPAQLEDIQKQSVHKLLTKLGMNRNMPRAVVYGPRVLGGRQLFNLQVEQPTLNLITTIGHLRREDRVADLLIATLRDIQVEVGISSFIIDHSPVKFPYVTQNTRWLYTWRICWDTKMTIEIWDKWIPTSKYQDDRNIMETAINDKFSGDLH